MYFVSDTSWRADRRQWPVCTETFTISHIALFILIISCFFLSSILISSLGEVEYWFLARWPCLILLLPFFVICSCQALSQDLKSGFPKCAIVCSNSQFIGQHVKNETIFIWKWASIGYLDTHLALKPGSCTCTWGSFHENKLNSLACLVGQSLGQFL